MASPASSQKFIAPTAIIDPTAVLGEGTKVWAFTQVAEHAVIGKNCVIGNGVYIDRHVKIGDRVRIHNKALLYHGLIVEDDVFIGPGVCFTNDRWPKSGSTRDLTGIHWRVQKWASIGANATILPDVSIGSFAIVGAGSVVTRAVANHHLVYGNPARFHGLVCECLHVTLAESIQALPESVRCQKCAKEIWPAPIKSQFKKERNL